MNARRAGVIAIGLLAAGCGSAAGHAHPAVSTRAAAPITEPAATVTDPCKPVFLFGESFVSRRAGFVVGEGSGRHCPAKLMATDDGGRTFQTRGSLPGYGVSFTSPQDGWAYGRGVSRTEDGGRTWTKVGLRGSVAQGAASGGTFLGLELNCNKVRCTYAEAVTTGDGRWTERRLPGSQGSDDDVNLQALLFSPYDGYLFAGARLWSVDGTAPPHLIRQPCGGREGSWTGPTLGGTGPNDLWLVCAWEPGAGSQEKVLYRSSDGGRHWRQLRSRKADEFDPSLHSPMPEGGYMAALEVSNPVHAYIALDRGTVVQTSDGGHHWRAAPLPGSPDADLGDNGPDAIDFIDPRHGWALTFNGAVYRTADAGRHWAVTNLG